MARKFRYGGGKITRSDGLGGRVMGSATQPTIPPDGDVTPKVGIKPVGGIASQQPLPPRPPKVRGLGKRKPGSAVGEANRDTGRGTITISGRDEGIVETLLPGMPRNFDNVEALNAWKADYWKRNP